MRPAAVLFFLFALLAAPADAELYKDGSEYLRSVEHRSHFSFDDDRDRNSFPDSWILEKGQDFEAYHSVLIDNRSGRTDNSSLHIVFTGGKVGVRTAPLRWDPRFAYNISLFYRGENLGPKNEGALAFGVRFYDSADSLLDSLEKRESVFPLEWTRSQTLRVERIPANAASCVLFIHLSGRSAGRSRLWIDDISIEASPRVQISTGRPLNIFSSGEEMTFTQTIEGTSPGASYSFETSIRDFLGTVVDSDREELSGNAAAVSRKRKVPSNPAESGVYTISSRLFAGGNELVKVEELVARNAQTNPPPLDPGFGVLLGRPTTPFGDMLLSMKTLGVSMSKISLLPENFSFLAFDGNAGMTELNPLLKDLALDEGYRFIGVLDRLPADAAGHPKFATRPAVHIMDTFPTHADAWKNFLEQMLFLYANVISDWQIGGDGTDVSAAQASSGNEVLAFLRRKADWSGVFLPTAWDDARDPALLHVPAKMSPDELASAMAARSGAKVHVTVELLPLATDPPTRILADLVEKVAVLKAAAGRDGSPAVDKIFVDRLNDDHHGLMSRGYKPFAAFFAMKTLVSWFQDARYLGRLFLEDKSIRNHVFRRHDEAFVLLWRNGDSKEPGRLYLGDGASRMDLMGNRSPLDTDPDHGVSVPISEVPIFVISPHPELLETIISCRLLKNDLSAEVSLQRQTISVRNCFAERAKFDFSVAYPQDWIVQDNVYSDESDPGKTSTHDLVLSPSSLAPLGRAVPVAMNLEISLQDRHHVVRLYREDALSSDISVDVSFFKADGGLNIVMRLRLDKSAKKSASFTATALFSGGESLEACFRRIRPGEDSKQSIYLRDGARHLGEEVSIEVKESMGDRHINRSFPVAITY